MKNSASLAISLLTALTLSACGGSEKAASTSEAASKAEAKEEVITVTAQELETTYGENEVGGDKKFKDKTLKVSGKIASIESGFGDEGYAVFKGKDPYGMNSVQAHFSDSEKDKVASLKKGAALTVQCTGGGEVGGTPMLKDCKVQ